VKTLAATLTRADHRKTEYELQTGWNLYTNICNIILNAKFVNCGLEQ